MALEDMVEKCIEAGVTHFELHDFLEGCDGERVAWHWDLYRGDPVKWIDLSIPCAFSFNWLGFAPDPNRLFGVLPFSVSIWTGRRIGILAGGERHGWQVSERSTLEEGLRAALGSFLCESEGRACPHEVCEFHGTEDCAQE